jgi:hypothetical protein
VRLEGQERLTVVDTCSWGRILVGDGDGEGAQGGREWV